MKTMVLSRQQNETAHGCGLAKIMVANLDEIDGRILLMTETEQLLDWHDVSQGNDQNSVKKLTAKILRAIHEWTWQMIVVNPPVARQDVGRIRDDRTESILSMTKIHGRIDAGPRQGILQMTMMILRSLERHEVGRKDGRESNAEVKMCPTAQLKVVGGEPRTERILDS